MCARIIVLALAGQATILCEIGQPERTDLCEKSATRSYGAGAVAKVRYRCSRSRLRESAACSRDSVQLSARKRDREGIESVPSLHPIDGTASRTNASDHAVLHGGARVFLRTVLQRARRIVPLRRH